MEAIIEIDLKILWMHPARDKIQWHDAVNMASDLQIQ